MRTALLIPLACLALAARPVGQTFTSSAELVTVPLTVTDRGRALVAGLTAADFRVFEDGKERPVTFVTAERQPVSVCVVLDRSLSVSGKRKEAAEALVDGLVRTLPSEDQISLVTFATQPAVEIDWVGADARPRIAWAQMPTGGGSALADALALAMRQLERGAKPQRVVLVLSDGRELGSVTPVWKLATTRRQSEALVYAFGLNVIVPAYPANEQYLQKLVGDSGGYVHAVWQLRDTGIAVRALIDEWASQYTLGFAPTLPFDGKYRRVKVETTNRELKVRHRGGYLALP